jgi:hypothetical protein
VFTQLLERAWSDAHPALTMVDPATGTQADTGGEACGPDGCAV